MNEIGFMSHDIMNLFIGYDVRIMNNEWWIWDRQTIVMMCENMTVLNGVREILRHNRRPNSIHDNINYHIDGFVNLDYKMSERDPANRNVRIVYCDMERMKIEEVYRRFQGGYIIRVRRKEEIDNGTSRIGRELPKISG